MAGPTQRRVGGSDNLGVVLLHVARYRYRCHALATGGAAGDAAAECLPATDPGSAVAAAVSTAGAASHPRHSPLGEVVAAAVRQLLSQEEVSGDETKRAPPEAEARVQRRHRDIANGLLSRHGRDLRGSPGGAEEAGVRVGAVHNPGASIRRQGLTLVQVRAQLEPLQDTFMR
jgi:hypothetical protein